jgi:hypothetical protein
MKATVQYNEFIGTAVSDISDHTDLNKFLASRGIDTDRNEAIGASFYSGYSDFFLPQSSALTDKNQPKRTNLLLK